MSILRKLKEMRKDSSKIDESCNVDSNNYKCRLSKKLDVNSLNDYDEFVKKLDNIGLKVDESNNCVDISYPYSKMEEVDRIVKEHVDSCSDEESGTDIDVYEDNLDTVINYIKKESGIDIRNYYRKWVAIKLNGEKMMIKVDPINSKKARIYRDMNYIPRGNNSDIFNAYKNKYYSKETKDGYLEFVMPEKEMGNFLKGTSYNSNEHFLDGSDNAIIDFSDNPKSGFDGRHIVKHYKPRKGIVALKISKSEVSGTDEEYDYNTVELEIPLDECGELFNLDEKMEDDLLCSGVVVDFNDECCIVKYPLNKEDIVLEKLEDLGVDL